MSEYERLTTVCGKEAKGSRRKNIGGGRMIEIVKQDIYNGEVLDTTLRVEFTIAVAGNELNEFRDKLNNLIAEYHI